MRNWIWIVVILCCARAHASDTCTTAAQIFDGAPAVSDNLSASFPAGSSNCGGNGNADHWYVYNAPCDGQVTITSCGTHDSPFVDAGMDTIISVYDGCGGTELACNDDDIAGICGNEPGMVRDAAVRVPVSAGTQLFIRVTHFGSFIAGGDFLLHVECAPYEAPVMNLSCSPGPNPDDFFLTWDVPASGTGIDVSIFSDESGIRSLIGNVSISTNTFSGSLVTPGASGQFEFCVEVRGSVGVSELSCCTLRFNPPVNDECSSAIPILAPGGSKLFDNTLATTNSPLLDNTLCAGPWLGSDRVHNDLWYEYTATTNGPVFASTCNRAKFDSKIAVYEKLSCPPLPGDLIRCNDDSGMCADSTSRVTWLATAGVTYLVQVGGHDNSYESKGAGRIFVSQEKPTVANLNCVHGAGSGEVVVTFDYPVGNLTNEVRFYVNEGGAPHFIGSVVPPMMTFVGSLENPELLGTIDICAEAIGVGVSEFTCCSLTLSGFLNDDCVTPMVIADGTPAAIGNLSLATQDGDTSCTPLPPMGDAWYSYTASCAGNVTFSTCGSWALGGIDTMISIHTGCPGALGNEMACSDDWGGCPGPAQVDSHVTVPLNAGQTVLVRVAHYPDPLGSGLGSGAYQLSVTPGLSQQPVSNLVGTDLGGGQFSLDFDLPTAPPTTQVVILSNEGGIFHPVGFAVPPLSTFTANLSNANFVGDVDFCVQAFGPCGGSTQTCTTVSFSGIPNDSCMNPTPLASPSSGLVTFVNTVATTGSPTIDPMACTHWLGTGAIERDLWYEYTASSSGEVIASLCGSAFDTKIAIYENTACPPVDLVACNDDASCNLQSEVTFGVSAGTSYLIQVGSFSPFGAGVGKLQVEQACPRPLNLTGSFDCHTGSVSLWWTDQDAYAALEVKANGTPLTLQPAPVGAGLQNNITHFTPPSTGIYYEVTATCVSGGSSSAVVWVDATQYLPGQDLILALEGLQSNGQLLGAIDSGSQLRTALEANGRSVALLRSSPRDYSCIEQLVDAAENVWVLLGTYPTSYALDTTSAGESAYLYELVVNRGKNLFIEGGDYLGFNHIASPLDDIDGIDLTALEDGDDSFDAMLASNAPLAGCLVGTAFSNPPFFGVIPYMQDSGANEWTDRYLTAGPADLNPDPGVASAEVLWRNHGAQEPPYVTGVIATNGNQRKVLTQSWEFGGFAGTLPGATGASARATLADTYLSAFASGIPAFRRGDCNLDAMTNIADAVATLNHLFPGNCVPGSTCPNLECESACDSNDDGSLNIADAISTLTILFPSGCVPGLNCPDFAAPGGTCGPDGTPDTLPCTHYPCP